MDGQENRRSFRISESVYVKYEILSDEEFQEGLERRKLKLGISDGAQAQLVDIEARLGEAMYLLSAEYGKIGRCMTLLNDKLNIVIDQLPALRETKLSLAKMPPQTCDVGADGMIFSSRQNHAIGDKLYLQFLLSTDNRYVETFCRVVRLDDPPDTSGQDLPYGIAVEFLNMPPAQREILIQHMFSRESETLRMRRLEMDAI
ncbi:MAG: PilZ domain-containing protein [Gammaproteobacteria bacterium]|nr:PilZ domain-containing protein [Gammaproteobacteria bacterium]